MNKVALITGVTGQDGSFLAEFLIEKGYEVHGIIRRSSSFNTERIEHLYFEEWVRDMKRSRATEPPLWRYDRLQLAHPHHPADSAR